MARKNTNIEEQVLEEMPVTVEEKIEEKPKTEPKKKVSGVKTCVA